MKWKFLRQLFFMSKLLFYGLVIQMCFTGLLLASDGLAQEKVSIEDVYLSLDLEDASLEQTLDAITQKTNFKFAFEQKNVERVQSLSTSASNQSLADILRDISKSTDLSFKRVNDNIFVSKKKFLGKSVEEDLANSGNFQGITVTGKVLSVEDNSGLPGVNIVVKGTTVGTVTDIEGNYSLEVPGENSVLVFSSVGYVSEEITVGSRTVIDFTLKADVTALSEIVVVGYGTQKRAEVTGAISSITSEAITEVPITSAEQALQGRAAGVNVVSNGQPGSSPVIRIRGLGTVNDNNPLIVVDGIVGARLEDINPNDIQSIEVLKDASTTAIYGALGANGVVMVTTKTGTKGKAKVNVDAWVGVQTQKKRYDVLNTDQYIQYATDVGNLQDPVAIPVRITDPQYASYLQNDTNWQDAIFQDGVMQNYNIGVSGGTEASSYMFSAGYMDQEGIIINTGFKRFNFRANSDFSVGKFKFGETLTTSINSQQPYLDAGGRSQIEHSIKMAPYLPIYNPDNLGGFQGPLSPLDNQDAENPVRAMSLTDRVNGSETILGTLYGQWEIIDGLKLKTQGGLNYRNSNTDQFIPMFDDAQNDGGGQHFSDRAQIMKNHAKNQSVIWTNSLTYTRTFAEKHNLEALLVAETQNGEYSSVNTSSTNLITDELNQVSLNEASLSSALYEYSRVGYLGRLNYNYEGKYILAASFRRDASSRFGANNRWGNFPSFAAGWRISEEAFMSTAAAISNLKLRGSWGKVGNDRIGDYRYSATLTNNYNYSFTGSEVLGIGTTAVGPANSDLKWEETTMLNIGLDVGFMNDQITLAAEYYKNQSDDLLMELPLSSSLGFHTASIASNVGSVETSGFEFVLGYNDYEGDFQWSANLNLGTSKNEVLSLGGVESIAGGGFENQNITRVVVGEPMFHFYGYEMEGIFQDQTDVDNHATQNNAEPGDVKFRDIAGAPDENGNPTGPDGVIDANDRTIIGNPYPKINYGLSANFDFKGFDFGFFLIGVSGNDVYNTNIYDLQGMTRLFNSGVDVLDRWTGPGTSNTIPRALGAGENVQVSTRFIEDGSYMRLRNISLGYTIPTSAFNNAVSRLRVYISGQNIFTISNYSGLDPEIGTHLTTDSNQQNFQLGIDRGNFPLPKSFTAGVQLTF
jgi:TonB-linked SusC/RagA family outer membrane protein